MGRLCEDGDAETVLGEGVWIVRGFCGRRTEAWTVCLGLSLLVERYSVEAQSITPAMVFLMYYMGCDQVRILEFGS